PKRNARPPHDMGPLGRALAALDAYLGETDADMLRALRPGVGEADVAAAARAVFGGSPFPPELLAWFGWHNGQHGTSQEPSPDRTFTLLDLREAVAAWESFRDLKQQGGLQEPWELSWFPLMTNGAGDYLVFESA